MAEYSKSVAGQVCCACGKPAICFVSNNNGSWLCASHFVAPGGEVTELIRSRRQSPAPVDASLGVKCTYCHVPLTAQTAMAKTYVVDGHKKHMPGTFCPDCCKRPDRQLLYAAGVDVPKAERPSVADTHDRLARQWNDTVDKLRHAPPPEVKPSERVKTWTHQCQGQQSWMLDAGKDCERCGMTWEKAVARCSYVMNEPSERAREEQEPWVRREEIAFAISRGYVHPDRALEVVEHQAALVKKAYADLRMLWLICDQPEKRWCIGDLRAALGEPPLGKE
jgi:hypothetical protein